ncbi:MAG: M20/M25/M40 family metallo-hydrolase, partial [Lachnospiraceae bacterium]|nr:M20/M25/M40 family metallo-hydrolase [Lachnospiraceae bacterium]
MTEYFNSLRDEWIKTMCAAIASKPLSGHEKGVADLLLKGLRDAGIEAYRDDAGNIIGVLRGTGDGPAVMTHGHMDVVPGGNTDAWNGRDPFVPVVENGRLYGRGASDMLMGTVSAFFTIREFKKLLDKGMNMNGTLIFAGVVNEEPAESMGTLHLLEKTLPELGLWPDLVILGEPCEGGIYLGSRGKVELVVDVYGKVAHSSAPWQGISAVGKAMPVMKAVINNMYKKSMTHHKLGFSAMCITDVEVSPGRMYSCVPDKCSITIDRRYVPPFTIQDTIDEIRGFLDYLASRDPDFKAEVHQRFNTRSCYTGLSADVAKQH